METITLFGLRVATAWRKGKFSEGMTFDHFHFWKSWDNMFPKDGGISATTSPRTMMRTTVAFLKKLYQAMAQVKPAEGHTERNPNYQ